MGNPFDALIVGCYDAGEKLKYVGKVRNGLSRTCAAR
jgi:ATP-dependent DNA ligase